VPCPVGAQLYPPCPMRTARKHPPALPPPLAGRAFPTAHPSYYLGFTRPTLIHTACQLGEDGNFRPGCCAYEYWLEGGRLAC